MVSFLAGLGSGYLKAQDKNHERERQDRLDQQANELHTARMSEIGDAQAVRQDERDYKNAMQAALSAGKTDTGHQVTDSAGSNAFTKDADAAAVMQDMAQILNGGASAAPATRVLTGMQGATQRGIMPGQQVFADPAKAQEFAKTQTMSDYAKLKARQAVAEQYAKLDVADDMRSKLESLAQKGVFQAGSLLDAGNAAGALKVLQNANPDLVPRGAQFRQVDVPDMFDRSKTTKGWALVAPGAEGQPERVLVGDFRDAVFGYLTPEKQFDARQALAKGALDERKTSVAERQAANAERKTDLMMQKMFASVGSGGGSGGARSSGGNDMPTPFNPLANFDSKKAQAVAFEQAAAATDTKGQPLDPAAQGQLAQTIYRSMEDAFAAENRNRHVVATVSADLRAARSDPARYAQEYAKAAQVMDAKTLEGLGFKSPTPSEPKPAASESQQAPKEGIKSRAPADPAKAATGSKAKELQSAYDAWQASKPKWFSQQGPMAKERERAAEARYTELLRNQYSK